MMKKILVIALASLLIITAIIFVNFKLSKKDVKLDETMTEQREENVRQPSVSGTFYPADPTTLENKINGFLSSSNDQMDDDQMVKLLIVPHAGYEYSGSVAADGFKQIENKQYDKVILIGSSHQSFFQGAVVDENTVWQTPLGKVNIDVAAAQEIVDADDNFNFNSSAHAQEHSLEVQLPFLQTVLDDFKIVPILFGQATDEDVNKLASTINQLLTPNTLILISTDLSHYPSYDIANSVDERTINSILNGNPEKFEQKVAEQMSEGYPNLDTCVCAEKAVKTGMIVAQKLAERGLKSANTSEIANPTTPNEVANPTTPNEVANPTTPNEVANPTTPNEVANFSSRSGIGGWKLIKYANSGDIVGEKGRVVGYAALTFSQKTSNVQSSNIQNELKKKIKTNY
jgi:MEMO1 family protein